MSDNALKIVLSYGIIYFYFFDFGTRGRVLHVDLDVREPSSELSRDASDLRYDEGNLFFF